MQISQNESLDPDEARCDAEESGLVVRTGNPLNCETSIPGLIGGVIVPTQRFYLRNHFDIPKIDTQSYRLSVSGLVEKPISLRLSDLRSMPSRSQVVTLECAGNGRALFDPPAEGEKWEFGAVSTAEWTGVPVPELLERSGVLKQAREAVFRGADFGAVAGRPKPIRFERSLRLDDPAFADALLAYAMNGEPLPIPHGYPLRLIVPGWYAVTSIKWLTQIDLVDRPFDGFYQAHRYWYRWNRAGQPASAPVTLLRVRSLITEPSPNQHFSSGKVAIRGFAWSGAGPVVRVEVSVGEGEWQEARLLGEAQRGCWQRWELITNIARSGALTLRARAIDQAGNTQPDTAEWNCLGYGNNSIQRVPVQIA